MREIRTTYGKIPNWSRGLSDQRVAQIERGIQKKSIRDARNVMALFRNGNHDLAYTLHQADLLAVKMTFDEFCVKMQRMVEIADENLAAERRYAALMEETL